MLGIAPDPERVGVEVGRRGVAVGRHRRDVPIVARITDAARVPHVGQRHGDLARVVGVAVALLGCIDLGLVHGREVGPHSLVEPLPGVRPVVGNLCGGAVIGQQAAGTEVRADRAQILVLRLVAPLGHVLGIEVGAVGIIAVHVDREPTRQLGQRVHVPLDLLAVEHVRITIRVRRVLEAGLVEHVAVVVEHRRVDREGQTDLSLAADVVELDRALGELAGVVAGRRDQIGEVQPLAVEGLGTRHTDRADDIGRVATRQLRRHDVEGGVVVDDLEHELDVVVRFVECLDHGLFGRYLCGVIARAEAAEPMDLDRFAGHGIAAGRLLRASRRRRWLRLALAPARRNDEREHGQQRAEA